MKKTFLVVVSLIFGIILSACNENIPNTEENTVVANLSSEVEKEEFDNSSLLPRGVLNGDVSEDYFWDLRKYVNGDETKTNELKEYLQRLIDEPQIFKDADFKKEFDDFSREYEVFLKGVSTHPSTPVDYEMDALLTEMFVYMELAIADYNSYIQSNKTNKIYLESFGKHTRTYETSLEALREKFVEYNIE